MLLPKQERHQKRRARVRGKKEVVPSEKYLTEEYAEVGRKVDWRMYGEGSQVRKGDKCRAGKVKKCERVEGKGDALGVGEYNGGDTGDKQYGSVDKKYINIKHWNIGEDYVGNRVARLFGRVDYRVVVYHERKKKSRERESRQAPKSALTAVHAVLTQNFPVHMFIIRWIWRKAPFYKNLQT